MALEAVWHKFFNFFQTIWEENRGLDCLRYLYSGLIWQWRKKAGHHFVHTLWNGARVAVRPNSVYSALFYMRLPDREELSVIRAHADLAPVFVDVGANVGLVSAHVCDLFQQIVVFEPAPATFQALQETIDLNPRVQWHAYPIGVGAEPGEMPFVSHGALSSTGHFSTQNGEGDQKIPLDTLDRIFADWDVEIILKVDVEGFEEQVFLGAECLFNTHRVRLLMFERLGRSNLERLRLFLESRGYRIFRMSRTGKPLTDEASIAEPLINLMACPENLFHRITAG